MTDPKAETCHLRTPLGVIRVHATGEGVSGIYFLDREPAALKPAPRGGGDAAEHLRHARSQLAEYFRGKRTDFELELDLRGSDFDCEVWQALLRIPFGRTRSYGQIAKDMGGVTLARAVGGACGRNPVSVVVPCHRVIGADRGLTGYGGGIDRKERLLRLEGVGFAAPQLGLFDR